MAFLIVVYGEFERHLIQGDQKVSVHMMITLQHAKIWLLGSRPPRPGGGGGPRLITPTVISNSNYVIMVND
jgi:hypothetical protein